jgi:uncharacterized membrane protein
VLAKVGAGRMRPTDEHILFTAGMLPLLVAAIARQGWRVERDRRGVASGVANGVCAGLGMLAFYAAMGTGSAAAVSAVTALFPLVTVALAAAVLHERINRWQGAGVVLAVAAILLLSV